MFSNAMLRTLFINHTIFPTLVKWAKILKNMKVKITVSYEIDNLIDEETLKEVYQNDLSKCVLEAIESEGLIGIVSDETLHLITIEKVEQYTDAELIEMVNEQFDYFKKFGDRHYSDTKDEQILEKYWDIITERVFDGLNLEENQVEEMDNRLASLF